MEIRYIVPEDDILEISRIYEKSWKFAYKNIIPQNYLDNISAEHWAVNIIKPDINNIVIIENGKYIGTSGFGKSRFPELKNSVK